MAVRFVTKNNFSETTYDREPLRGISQFSFQLILS